LAVELLITDRQDRATELAAYFHHLPGGGMSTLSFLVSNLLPRADNAPAAPPDVE